MKIFLILFVVFILPFTFTFSQITVIDDFESGLGAFNTHIGENAQGLKHTMPRLDPVTTAYQGFLCLRMAFIDNDTSNLDWIARFLSYSGDVNVNIKLDSIGVIGFWLKTTTTYMKTAVCLNAPGGGLTALERSDTLHIIGDGQWHNYEFNLGIPSQWHIFGGAIANGKLEKPITLNSLVFYASNADGNADTAVVWLDYVYYNHNAPLPVELSSFTTSVEKNTVDLKWITATEKNNSGFDIERRTDKSPYEKIAFVAGKGTTAETSSYIYSDVIKAPGNYFYRLKQKDYDGTFNYSKEEQVIVAAMPGIFSLAQNYPNPFNPSTSISFNIPAAGVVNLSVYNLLGQKVAEPLNTVLESGIHTVNFASDNLASGTYIYTLKANGNSVSKKMLLLK